MLNRITSKRSWKEASEDLTQEMGYSHIWKRLNAIENILGDEYDIEDLAKMLAPDNNVGTKTADEMFRELGYEKFIDQSGMFYSSNGFNITFSDEGTASVRKNGAGGFIPDEIRAICKLLDEMEENL